MMIASDRAWENARPVGRGVLPLFVVCFLFGGFTCVS